MKKMKRLTFSRSLCPAMILAIALGVSVKAPATTLEKKLYEAAKKEAIVEYWDTLSMKEISELWKGFESKYPGIKLKYFEATSDVREEKYLAEHSAGRHTADIVPLDLYKKFKEKGLLLNLSDIVNDTGYPKKFCSPDLDLAAVEHTLTGTVYNTKLVSQEDVPRTLEDLLDSKWRGKINIESRMKYFIFGTDYWGESKTLDYLKKLRKQNPSFTRGATATMALLAAGEFPITIGIYFHRTLIFQEKGAPVEWAPISPVVDYLTSHAIMRHAPHPNASKLFLRWWMSPEGAAHVDSKRHKGNPMPGSGTQTSKILEKRGMPDIHVWAPWGETDQKTLQKKYQSAVGFTKEKLKTKKKKK